MWEPGAGSLSNTNGIIKRNRGVVLLLGVLACCLLVYKAWGPLLLISCALVLVVHTCYSLLVNDSLLAPHTLVLLAYARELALELLATVRLLAELGAKNSGDLVESVKRWYGERQRRRWQQGARGGCAGQLGDDAAGAHDDQDMNGRRNVYRLSTTGTDLAEQVSPINNDPYHSFAMNGVNDVAMTSTPLPRGVNWRKGVQQNGEIGLFTPIANSPSKKLTQLHSENKQPTLPLPRPEQTRYSPKGSPWGNSISPKMRDKAAGIKTVQTVAGPLLASTRYNIDPRTYTDISSPGLTSRLTKYATEANNKLTHQPQYGTGQFPKVNLNASPTPLLSPKLARARIPVTVRVAPPEMLNYSPSDAQSHQERHKMYSASEVKESKSCPNVAQVLKKISLKRHASREDIMLDLAKKQRAERIYEGQLENLEEMMQKRARDESMTSEDDLSPQSKTQRPSKRPKASSCHDILNSLSSSINVFSGVKRKAMDTSRCNTPDIEKHFKPSSRSPNRSSSLSLHSSGDAPRSKEQLNVKVPIVNTSGEPHHNKAPERTPDSASKTDGRPPERQLQQQQQQQPQQAQRSPKALELPTTPKAYRENPLPSRAGKLTDKLFMRPEPQINEKLRNLIEEQGSVEARFTTDDKDEIKKQDIVNMRQNNMQLRLKSMFEAISGKSSHKIDPDVVIQAEEIHPATSSSVYTSLSSGTITTSVNTSPITTTIVPILKTDTEHKSPTTKHVTFNLPSSATSSFGSTTSSLSGKESAAVAGKPATQPFGSAAPSAFGGLGNTVAGTASTSSSAPSTTSSFSFGPSSLATSTPAGSSSKATSVAGGGFSFPASAASKVSTTEAKTTATTAAAPVASVASALFSAKSTAVNLNATTVISSSGFSFGNAAKSTAISTVVPSAPATSFTSMASAAVAKGTEMGLTGGNATVTSFGNPLTKSPASTAIALPSSQPTSSFAPDKKPPGGFSFGAPTSSPSLGASAGPAQPGPLFGMPTTSSPMFSSGSNQNNATSAPSSMFSSGGGNATATIAAPAQASTAPGQMFAFGAGAKPTNCFSFAAGAQQATTPASTATAAGGGGFGASTATGSFAPPVVSSAMGSPAVSASNTGFGTSGPALFGGSANSASLFSGASSATGPTASMFKSPATTTTTPNTSIFGTPTGTPTFGSQPAASSTAASSTPSLFGNQNPTASSTIPSLFGNAATATIAPTSISAFGGQGAQQQQQQGVQGGGIFSGVNANAVAPSTSIFGAANPQAVAGGMFSGGQAGSSSVNLASSSTPSDSTSIFGQAKSPSSLSFSTPTPAFGSAQQVTSPSSFQSPNPNATSAFQLGGAAPTSSSSTAALPSFSVIKPTTQFGASSNPSQPSTTTTSGGGLIFGSSTTGGGFGSTAAPPPAFSSSAATSAFGAPAATAATAPPPAFGAHVTAGSTAAGGPVATGAFGGGGPAATGSPFGGAQTTSGAPTASLFGNATAQATGQGVSGTGSFSFGGGQQTQQPQQPAQQPNASFAFGGAAPPNPANSGGLFQFGGAPVAKPAGFNFNAPTAGPTINFSGAPQGTAPPAFNAPAGAPPAFNAPATNMFSIGSGSSTPRTRTSRTRRQR